jgi:NADPH:quinone reductase-like Zn-dependent oxidoreductase
MVGSALAMRQVVTASLALYRMAAAPAETVLVHNASGGVGV